MLDEALAFCVFDPIKGDVVGFHVDLDGRARSRSLIKMPRGLLEEFGDGEQKSAI